VGSVSVACCCDPSTAIPGTTLEVTVSVPIATISTIGKTWFGQSHLVTATSVMRKEGFE
jgi:hypothetical protein